MKQFKIFSRYQRRIIFHNIETLCKEFLKVFCMTVILSNYLMYIGIGWTTGQLYQWCWGLSIWQYASVILAISLLLLPPILYYRWMQQNFRHQKLIASSRHISILLDCIRLLLLAAAVITAYLFTQWIFPYKIHTFVLSAFLLFAALSLVIYMIGRSIVKILRNTHHSR